MLPSRPRVGPVALPEEVAERVGGGDAAREVARELAVERARRRRRAEREAGAGGDGLLAATRVDRPGIRPCR